MKVRTNESSEAKILSIPKNPINLMKQCYQKVFPTVNRELKRWNEKAKAIPDAELRQQALNSQSDKRFHCEGGAILALLAKDKYEAAIKFIVAYQTISDYLDNLCDRSTSLNPLDFRTLHQSMVDCLKTENSSENYYRFRNEQDDGGYLQELVETCQSVLKDIQGYHIIRNYLIELCRYYCDLQVHKHVKKEERLPRLKNWFAANQESLPEMTWYEFAACSGSTLGIFCLVSYAMRDDFTEEQAQAIRDGYFPYIQGLHILLDYFIDQEEDLKEGDLNFCTYYENDEMLLSRFQLFIEEADKHTGILPDQKFHQMINRGLLGLYLSDSKIKWKKQTEIMARKIRKQGGWISQFFYINAKIYQRKQQII